MGNVLTILTFIMKVCWIVFPLALVGYVIYRQLIEEFPDGVMAGLYLHYKEKTPKGILAGCGLLTKWLHYSLVLIFSTLKNHWLWITPLVLAFPRLAVQFYYTLQYRAYLIENGDYDPLVEPSRQLLLGVFETWRAFGLTFIQTLEMLDYGFITLVRDSQVFALFCFVCCLGFKIILNKLKRLATSECSRTILFLERYSAIWLILTAGLALSLWLGTKYLEPPDHFKHWFQYMGMMLWHLSISLLVLPWFSLLQGMILFSLKAFFEKEKTDFVNLIRKSVRIWKQLFVFNVILVGPYLLGTIYQIAIVMFDGLFAGATENAFSVAAVSPWLNPPITVLLMCVPFALTVNPISILEAIKIAFRFMSNNVIRYAFYIIGGVLLLFPFKIVGIILSESGARLMLFSILLNPVIQLLGIAFSMVFYAAMFKFYLDYQPAQS